MNNVTLIARRELSAYLRTMSGYIIIALMLLIDGLLFNGWATVGTAKKSSEVLADFFYLSSGIGLIGSIFLSMRLLAEERQTGTIQLLYSSPVTDAEIVLGKYLGALGYFCLFLLASLYIPALVFFYGKISFGHLAAGYFGLVLLGSMCLAVGTFGSALTRSQVVAAVLTAVMLATITLAWWLAKVTDRPLTDVVGNIAWYPHFKPFEQGLVHLKHVTYFVLVTYVSLFLSTRVIEARRWR